MDVGAKYFYISNLRRSRARRQAVFGGNILAKAGYRAAPVAGRACKLKQTTRV